jgi:hypothetical protein
MSGQVANQRLVELTVHEEHGEFYEDGGDFLPLSVLTQQGFNATSIEENALPKDQRDHPVLGKTYRVNIIKGGFRGTKTVGKSDKLLAAGQMGGGGVQRCLLVWAAGGANPAIGPRRPRVF